MLPLKMSRTIEFTEYVDANGSSPFAKWFDALDAVAAAKVRVYITRVELGNYSNVEPIGDGLSEIKIDYGPGYRVYFRKEKKRFSFSCWAVAVKRGSKKRLMQQS